MCDVPTGAGALRCDQGPVLLFAHPLPARGIAQWVIAHPLWPGVFEVVADAESWPDDPYCRVEVFCAAAWQTARRVRAHATGEPDASSFGIALAHRAACASFVG